MRIFIAIYIFADCIVNRDRFGIIFDGFSPRSEEHIEALTIRYAIDKIISIENISMSIVPNITRDVIKSNLVTAVGHLRGVASEMPFEQQPRDYRAALIHDPVFSYIFFGLGHAREVERSSNEKDPFSYWNAIFDLLEAKPKNPRNVYETLIGSRKTRDKILEFMIESIQLRIFDFPLDTTNRPIIDFRKRFGEFSRLLSQEEHHRIERAKLERGVPHKFITKLPDELDKVLRTPIALSSIYDINGIEHKWGTLIFAPVGVKTSAAIEIPLGSPNVFKDPSLLFVDKKCTGCGVLRSATGTIDEKAVKATLDVLQDIQNLFRFFELRCPKEGAHSFSDKLECTKCAYSQAKSRELDRDYYATYSAQFHEAIEWHDPIRAIMPSDNAAPDEAKAVAYATQLWSHNYELIVSAADKFGIARHDLQILGAREGLTKAEISDESFVARIPKTRVDTRIFTLRSYIFEIFMLYGSVMHIASLGKVQSPSILRFIDDLKKASLNNLTMPPIDELLAKSDIYPFPSTSHILMLSVDKFGEIRKPAEIVEFYLELLCAILLTIRASGSKTCESFAKLVINRIIARETMTAKPDHVNLSVIAGTKLANDDFDTGATGEMSRLDTYEDDAEDDKEEDTDEPDPFSLDAFDIDDVRADDEVYDPEDAETIMHLGSDMGW